MKLWICDTDGAPSPVINTFLILLLIVSFFALVGEELTRGEAIRNSARPPGEWRVWTSAR